MSDLNKDCIVVKNKKSDENLFWANKVSSSYFYHSKNNKVEYLVVEA